MNCTNCGHELTEGSKFCTECGQPVRATYEPAAYQQERTTYQPRRTTYEPERTAYEPGRSSATHKKKHKKKKKKKPIYKRWWFIVLAVFFALALIGSLGSDETEVPEQEPEMTATETAAPEITTEPTPEATTEPTPTPAAGLANAQILEMTGAMICTEIIENGFGSNFIHSDAQLIIGVVYDMSFDACKSMGAAHFALEGWEETLIKVYNSTVEVANTYGATNYYVSVNLWSREQKTIMSCSSAGIDYNIK